MNRVFHIFQLFCILRIKKNVDDEFQKRIVIDIKKLNVFTISNVYSLSLQTNIISTMRDCFYISIVDVTAFFYQWRVHLCDRHKLTVVIHKNQKSFNVVVMKYKNNFVYVQRQIDRLLRKYRRYARVYINDIIIFFKTIEKHAVHLRAVFKMFQINNIFIKFTKTFFDYFLIALFEQKMNFFDLSTSTDKLKAIAKIQFSKIFRILKTYFDFIEYFREYVFFYADVFKSLQVKKIELFKSTLIVDNVRKFYASRIRLNNSTSLKKKVFKIFQFLLFELSYFIHHDFSRQLFVDLNFSKKFEINAFVYYVKVDAKWNESKYSSRKFLKLIFFLNRLLTFVETRYWFIEFELAELIWIFKKIRHMIESSSIFIVIYIDHDAALKIVKQITFTTLSTNKLNLRLIKAFDYMQRFNLKIRHKFEVQHVILDVFSRFASFNIEIQLQNYENEFDVLFIVILIEMNNDFRFRILKSYQKNSSWKKIVDLLNKKNNFRFKNKAFFSFFESQNSFFARTILSLTFMISCRVNYVFFDFSLTKSLIQYTTLSMNTMIFTNVISDWFFHTSYESYFLNFAFIYVIVLIIKYIKLVDINHTIFYNRYYRHRFFFIFWQ